MKPLSELIKESGLTQSEFAEKLNISKQHAYEFFKGVHPDVRISTYERIANALGFEISVKKLKKSKEKS